MTLFRKIIKPFLLIILVCGLAAVPLTCSKTNPEKKNPVAEKGVLVTGGWDFLHDGALNLDGAWEFYPDRLLEPSDFKKPAGSIENEFIMVPGLWKGTLYRGKPLPGIGNATYRLRIVIGNETRLKALTIHRVFSAYRLWINGALSGERGVEDSSLKSREDYNFIHNKSITSFTPVAGENEIIIQVFNQNEASGGIGRSIKLEDNEIIDANRFRNHAINMIVVGLLLFAAIYNMLLFIYIKDDRMPLYFSIFCLIWAVNIFNLQIPILSGGLSYHRNPYLIDYITVMLCLPVGLMTIRSLYTDEFPLLAIRLSQIVTVIFITSLFFITFRTSELILKAFFIFGIMNIVYCVTVLARVLKNRRNDAVPFFIGFAVFFICTVNDIMYASWIINTTNVSQFGLVILCMTTSSVISKRFAREHQNVKKLSEDLSEKNAELQEMDRLKNQFLANTSHELRTPLHGMIGLSESMMENSSDGLPVKTFENISLIATNGHRLANMINDLLDMAKIQDEGLSLNIRSMDIHSVAESVIQLSRPMIGNKPVEIYNNISRDMPDISADEDRIKQVLFNLVSNAIKFTHRGSIELSSRIINGRESGFVTTGESVVEVSVSDTGIGITDMDRNIIFDPYRQIDAGDTRTYPGTGLGLAIARKIVESHGGAISVSSGPSGGSVFTFSLPISKQLHDENPAAVVVGGIEDAMTFEASSDASEGTGDSIEGNPVILVVDDDETSCKILCDFFESRHCTVKTVNDGISALDCMNHDPSIDLVLMDIMMPAMSGLEVCRRIRLEKSPEELPVVMVTAKSMMSDIDAAFKAGANDYIVKPFRIKELLARVKTMIRLRNIRKPSSEGITIRDRNRIYSIKFSEIIYITSHSKNVIFYTVQGDIEIPFLMKDIIPRLPSYIFLRIHKSHIININYVHSVSHVISGRYRVRLRDDDDTELPVGPSYLDLLRKKMPT
jgi:signal transduction histidine kinase/DNA-binding LytR/AlgR family response regulator